jgi:hypothetical protein
MELLKRDSFDRRSVENRTKEDLSTFKLTSPYSETPQVLSFNQQQSGNLLRIGFD